MLLDMARELAVVHEAGVVHRDIKGDNLLVREDGRPVLVDFGVATYAGAPRVTGPEVPGCREYLSPEAVRFNRESALGARREATTLDDLWAVGVVAYKLLTATYPFSEYNAMETEKAILLEAPVPPHERNPRVPRLLGEVCLRLLEKEPGARYPDADALAAALEEAKRAADETWQKPLCEAWGPDAATTQGTLALSAEERRARLARLVKYEQLHPRRGQPRPAPEAMTTPSPPLVAARPVPDNTVVELTRPPRHVAPWLTLAFLFSALALGGLALLAAMHQESAPVPLATASAPTSAEDPFLLTLGVMPWLGQEVAPPWKPPEGDEGAAPSWAPTSAPVANATLPKEGTRVKISRNAPATRKNEQQSKETDSRAGQTGGALLVCALATGCPSPTTQVRPTPGPAECPPGVVEARKELGAWRDSIDVTFTPTQSASILTLHGGEVTVETLDDNGRMVAGSTLIGQLIITRSRVYGRFTQARLPSGEEYPVCFQFVGGDTPEDTVLRRPGVVHDEAAPGPDLARIFSTQTVQPVKHFD